MHFLLAYIGMRRQIDTLIQLSNCDDDNDMMSMVMFIIVI